MKTTASIDAARLELLLTELRLPAVKLMWKKLAARRHAVMGAQFLVAPRQVVLGVAIEVTERRRQAVAAVLFRHPAQRPQRVLQAFGERHEALAAEHHMGMRKAPSARRHDRAGGSRADRGSGAALSRDTRPRRPIAAMPRRRFGAHLPRHASACASLGAEAAGRTKQHRISKCRAESISTCARKTA